VPRPRSSLTRADAPHQTRYCGRPIEMTRDERTCHERMDAMSRSDADGRGESAHALGTDAAGWAAIDEALRKFTAASVIPLLSAAIDAPWTRPWQRHLTLMWFRAVSVPPTGSRSATDSDLAELAVEVAGPPCSRRERRMIHGSRSGSLSLAAAGGYVRRQSLSTHDVAATRHDGASRRQHAIACRRVLSYRSDRG
jgi:hypothetical protein